MIPWIACALLGTAAPSQTFTPPFRPSIVVMLNERDGFIDAEAGTLKSARRIARWLAQEKEQLELSGDRQTADVVLTIVTRGKGPSTFGAFSQSLPSLGLHVTTPFAANEFWILASLRSGAYTMDFTCRTMDGWNRCADMIAHSVRTWVAENRSRLQQQRASGR